MSRKRKEVSGGNGHQCVGSSEIAIFLRKLNPNQKHNIYHFPILTLLLRHIQTITNTYQTLEPLPRERVFCCLLEERTKPLFFLSRNLLLVRCERCGFRVLSWYLIPDTTQGTLLGRYVTVGCLLCQGEPLERHVYVPSILVRPLVPSILSLSVQSSIEWKERHPNNFPTF